MRVLYVVSSASAHLVLQVAIRALIRSRPLWTSNAAMFQVWALTIKNGDAWTGSKGLRRVETDSKELRRVETDSKELRCVETDSKELRLVETDSKDLQYRC